MVWALVAAGLAFFGLLLTPLEAGTVPRLARLILIAPSVLIAPILTRLIWWLWLGRGWAFAAIAVVVGRVCLLSGGRAVAFGAALSRVMGRLPILRIEVARHLGGGYAEHMRLLFLGDVMGRAGRAALVERLPGLRAAWGLDFVVVNGENASQGAGLTGVHAKALFAAGADCVTLGDHAFDQKDMISYCETEGRILRPLNFSRLAPGRGARVFTATQGRRVLVLQALGQVFMKRPFDDPFSAVEALLKTHPLGGAVQATIVEFHAEATSEKMAMGHWCDGQASLVVGTHTHVPTGDAMILGKGTAYLSDAGMCGDYDSVIGMEKLEPLKRFITGMTSARFEPAGGEATLCGVYVETDDRTGLALRVAMVRQGGRLQAAGP